MRFSDRKQIALLIVLAMLTSLLSGFSVLAGEADAGLEPTGEEVTPEEEYPKDVEYDFTVPGSTVSFLDKDGVLLYEEADWLNGEGVVDEWHVFMYREEQRDLRLGYSPDGTLFIPHRVYEGETADLLYVHDNSLFRVTATKQEKQVFDGSALLRELTVSATDGTVVLGNSPVYAQTPFGFVHLGNTDAAGQMTLYATEGEFVLWVTSHSGYLLSQTFTVAEGVSELSFADALANAVELDVKGRAEVPQGAPGYVVALGLPGEQDAVKKLTTSYVDPAQTVRVTPGTYSLATVIYLAIPETNNYIDGYYGLWIDLAAEQEISQKTEFDFTIEDFEPVFALNDKKETYGVEDLMTFRLYATHRDGYSIPGEADPDTWRSPIEITDGEATYPYTFCWSPFSALYDSYVYRAGNEDEVILTFSDHDCERTMPSTLFDTVENQYVVKYYPKWDSMACPTLFPENVFYSETFKTQAASYVLFSEQRLSLAYLDKDGAWQYLYGDAADLGYRWVFPAEVTEGTLLKIDDSSWVYDSENDVYEYIYDYRLEVLNDALVSRPYTFVPSTEAYMLTFDFVGESEELQYSTPTGRVWIDYQGSMLFITDLYGNSARLPAGEYVLDAYVEYAVWPEPDQEPERLEQIRHIVPVQLTEDRSFTFTAEGCASFILDGIALVTQGEPVPESLDKLPSNGATLLFENGVCSTVPWSTLPVKVYVNELPYIARVERTYYDLKNEMTPFTPYVCYEEFEIEDGGVYRFEFAPESLTVLKEQSFTMDRETVLQMTVTDLSGNTFTQLSNLINVMPVHSPLLDRQYPFVDENGRPTDHHYTVTVYYRAVGESEYIKVSSQDLRKINLGLLEAGEYEGYAELAFDTYSDEYLTEYPYEKGIMYDEWWAMTQSVYDNVQRVLHGTLSDSFTFTVVQTAHEHKWGAWQPIPEADGQHQRTCECGEIEADTCQWDGGAVTTPPSVESDGVKTYTCELCGAEKTEPVARAVITLDGSYATDASKTYVISAEEDGENFSFTLPEADVLGEHGGFVLIGWKCQQNGMLYPAGEVITGDPETELKFRAEWLTLIGEGEHELHTDRLYMAQLNAFTLDNDPSIYKGYQIFCVAEGGTYTVTEADYEWEDVAQ